MPGVLATPDRAPAPVGLLRACRMIPGELRAASGTLKQTLASAVVSRAGYELNSTPCCKIARRTRESGGH